MKIEQTSAQGIPVVKQTSTAVKTNPSAAGATEAAAADSVELSPQAQKVAKAQQNAPAPAPAPTPAQAQPTQAITQQASLLSAAKNMINSNPAKASSQLEMIIAQYPNSSEAQKARQLLARIPQAGK